MFERLDKSYDKDSLRTPQYIMDWLAKRYTFDIDLAANHNNHVCATYFTKKDDALSKNWLLYGKTGFCNPPYSKEKGMRIGHVDLFVNKAIEQAIIGFTTVMLIPELNGEARTKRIMLHATKIFHFDKRISFIHPITGRECAGNNRGSIIVEFSQKQPHIPTVHIFASLDQIYSTALKECGLCKKQKILNKKIHNVKICDSCDSKNWQTTEDVSQLLDMHESQVISYIHSGNSKKVPTPDLKITLGLEITTDKKKIISSKTTKGFYLWRLKTLHSFYQYDKANMLLNKKLIDEPVIID